MVYGKSLSSTEKNDDDNFTADNKISLEKNIGPFENQLEEFGCQWKNYVKRSYITTQRSDFIKTIKDEADEYETIVVHMDFAENHTLLAQKEIMQAHWQNQQAAGFTIHAKIVVEKHIRMIVISGYLADDVELVYAVQSIINDYVQSSYPAIQ